MAYTQLITPPLSTKDSAESSPTALNLALLAIQQAYRSAGEHDDRITVEIDPTIYPQVKALLKSGKPYRIKKYVRLICG